MRPNSIPKRLARHFPLPTKPEDLADEDVRVLSLFLSSRAKKQPLLWLRERLAEAVIAEGNRYCEAHGLLPAEPDIPSLFPPERPTRRAALPSIHTLLRVLDPELESVEMELADREKRSADETRRGFHRLYRSAPQEPNRGDAQRWHQELVRAGPWRKIALVSKKAYAEIEALHERAPHFAEPIRFITGCLRMARKCGSRELSLPPILLVGPPGTGKTWFFEELARILGLHSVLLPIGQTTAGFVIGGTAGSWQAAEPGVVAKLHLSRESSNASPMLILDELEKAPKGNYPVYPALLGLTDLRQAQRFRDEFLGMELDVSRTVVVASANSLATVDEALRSRFRIFHIERPKARNMASVVNSAWRSFREFNRQWRLPKQLDEEIVSQLARRTKDFRSLHKEFLDIVFRASLREGPIKPMADDLEGACSLRLVSSREPTAPVA